MIDKKSLSVQLRLIRPLLHALIIFSIFFLTYKIRLHTDLIPWLQLRIPPIDTIELQHYAILSVLIWWTVAWKKSLYDIMNPIRKYNIKHLHARWTWFVIMAFIAYFGSGFLFSWGISRFIIIWSALVRLIMWSAIDLLWNILIKQHQKRYPYNILIVYQSIDKRDIVVGQLQDTQYDLTCLNKSEWSDITYDKYHIVIAVWDFTNQKLQKEFDQIRLANNQFYHIPGSWFLDDVVYASDTIWSLHAFRCLPTQLDGWSLVIKRLFDVFLSFFLLLLLLVPMLIIAIFITAETDGPIIYQQKRVGKGHKLFNFLKFRTMYTHMSTWEQYGWKEAEKLEEKLDNSAANIREWILTKIKNDPRVTKVWRILRKTSLDELPQLFCVLRWSMSLVGPRPHLPKEVAQYQERHTRVLSVKPGITGYAQIFGRDQQSFDDEAAHDLRYIANWSIWLDIYALIKTIGVITKWK